MSRNWGVKVEEDQPSRESHEQRTEMASGLQDPWGMQCCQTASVQRGGPGTPPSQGVERQHAATSSVRTAVQHPGARQQCSQGPKAGATRVSIRGEADKRKEVCAYNEMYMPFSLKKEGDSDTCCNMDEP